MNPLFDAQDNTQRAKADDQGYVLGRQGERRIEPVNHLKPRGHRSEEEQQGQQAAVELIRRKLDSIYANEPDAAEEIAEVSQPIIAPSKHQLFMQHLSTSGKSLAEIQVAWHEYYTSLPDPEKHEVWREFYANNNRQPTPYAQHVQHQAAVKQAQREEQQEQQKPITTGYTQPERALFPSSKEETLAYEPMAKEEARYPHLSATKETEEFKKPTVVVAEHQTPRPATAEHRSVSQIKKKVVKQVRLSEHKQIKAKQHFQSLLFGLSTGVIVLLVLLFGLFNELVITPFIQPSRQVGATPIILNADSVAPSETPEVIIPKINVQIPVVYDEKSIDEAAVQRALERGTIHYPTTALPGQQGNVAVFGHSSNNIFNKGKYKFAFVFLRELAPGDIFHLTYDKKVYSYRVFHKKVVPPTEVSVLNDTHGKMATAALITCDPPGTSTNRLVVIGEQISPDPAGAAAPALPAGVESTTPAELPSEGPTLLRRIWDGIF